MTSHSKNRATGRETGLSETGPVAPPRPGPVSRKPHNDLDWLSASQAVIIPKVRNYGPGLRYKSVKLNPSFERADVWAIIKSLLVTMSI